MKNRKIIRTYRRTIKFNIVIKHTGSNDFNDTLDALVGSLVAGHAYLGVYDSLCFALTRLLKKNGFGKNHQKVFDKIESWELEKKKSKCSHENQYIGDRSTYICSDCDEELGR